METPLKSIGSISQGLNEQAKEESISEEISEEIEGSKSQNQGEDDCKPPTEQAEDSIPEDLQEQSRGWTETLLETSEQQPQEERERSYTHPSSSWGKSTADWKDDLSSFLATEPDLSTHFDTLSLDSKISDLETTSWIEPELETPRVQFGYEELPYSLWKKTRRGWKNRIPKCSMTEHKVAFHDCCCSSAIERSKALYNLYTTFYDEEEFDPYLVEGAKAHGNLDFVDFLDVPVHKSKPSAIPTESKPSTVTWELCLLRMLKASPLHRQRKKRALQNAQQVFRKIKKDMVNIEDLEPILSSLGVTLSSKIVQEALGCTQITWDGKLNISEFLSAVKGPISHQRELDEYISLERGPCQDFTNLDDLDFQWQEKWCLLNKEILSDRADLITFYDPDEEIDLAQLQRGTNIPQKPVGLRQPNTTSPVCHIEEKDKGYQGIAWPKVRPGYTSQDTLFPLSSSLPFKESDNVKKQKTIRFAPAMDQNAPSAPFSIAQSANYEAIQKRKKKKTLSFQEHLPRRYDSEDDSPQASNSRKPGSERKGHPKGQSDQKALQDAFDVIHMLAGDNIKDHELWSILKKLGVDLNNKEFQELLKKADVEKDGMVNFNGFMVALGKTRLFTELAMLKNTIQAIEKIEGDKMIVHDLPFFVKNLGIRLSDQEFDQALKQVPVDGSGKVVVKDFIKVLTNIPYFSELSVLKHAIKAINNIQGNKVPLQDLKSTLKNMGICLYPKEYEELIQTTPIDKEGNVDIEQIKKKISKTERFKEMEALNNTIKAFSQFSDGKVKASDIEACLNNIGIHLTKSELAHATRSIEVSSVFEAILALKFIKEYKNMESKRVRRKMNTFGLQIANEVITQVLTSAQMTETGQARFNDFLRTLTRSQQFQTSAALADGFNILAKLKNGRIGVEDLQVLMKSFNMNLPSKDLSEALAFCSIDGNKTVNLKDFLRGVAHTSTFITSPVLKETFNAMSNIKDNQIHVDDLPKTLAGMGINLTPEELQQLKNSVTVSGDGTVNFKDIMMNITGTQSFAEFHALQKSFNVINATCKEKIKKEDLPAVLEGLGIQLSPDELQAALALVSIDESGKLDGTEVLKILSNAPQFSKLRALQNAMKIVENIKIEKMSVNELEKTLENMGVCLPKTVFNEVIKAVKIDANGKIDFKDFLLALGETEDFAEVEALQRAITTMDATCGSQLQINELQIALDNLGIHLSNEEFQEVLHAIKMDADGSVNLKDFLITLSKMKRFTDSASLHSNVCSFSKIKSEKIDVGELESMLNYLGIDLNKMEFQKALKSTSVDENGKVNFKEFLVNVMDNERFSKSSAVHDVYRLISVVDNDKVEVSQMKDVLDAIGITLTKEEMKEVQKNIPVDKMEEAMKTMNSIKQDKANIEELESIARRMDIHLSPDEIQQALKYVSKNEDDTVSVKDFMFGLTNTQRFSKSESAPGDTVAVEDVSSLLSSMGIQLTKEQLQDTLKHVKVDENGKVNITELMKSVGKTQSEADMDRVHFQDLDAVLTKMGIYLIKDEIQHALKYAHVDGDGRVNLNDFMNGLRKTVQLIAGAEGKVIEIGDLSSSLAKMGIHLTEEEMQEALKYVVLDRDKVAEGKVNLGEFMKWLRVVQLHPPSSDETMNFSEPTDTVQEIQGSSPAANNPKEEITVEKVPDVLVDGWTKEKKVDIDSLDAVLDEIGIHLTNKQLYEALKYAPMDADGKVELEPFMRGVNAILTTQKTGKSVDISNLESILADMGLHLTQDEVQQALRQTTLNKDGSVDLKDFMWAIQSLPSIQNKQVHINNLDSVLVGMGIYLSQEELQDALKMTKCNENGMVNLKDFIRACNATLTLSSMEVLQRIPPPCPYCDYHQLLLVLLLVIIIPPVLVKQQIKGKLATPSAAPYSNSYCLPENERQVNKQASMVKKGSRYPSKMSTTKSLKLPKVVEKHRCLPNSGRMFSSGTPSEVASFKGVKDLTKPQLEAFRDAYDTFSKDLDGNVDLSALETTAYKLGINLTEEEAFDELVYADTDGDGKVNFTDFLNIITDSKRFIQAVAPKKGDMETVDAQGILLFELVSKLVETSMLSRKTTVNIVSYYRKKFLEATGKKAWRADSIDEDAQRRRRAKKGTVAKARSTPMSAFAGAARICVMNDKELREYLEHLQGTIKPSESPYAQVPIFPLIPNRDILLKGRPKKDLQKLEAQRRMEPLSSFEDHFFRKKRWLKQEPQPSKAHKTSLTLTPDLTRRRLTLNNLDEIRKEVKRVTTAYRMSIALRERNKSLKLWRRLRGGEIGLETGNPTFYQTFSTYSWSWNVCQELLTPRELREYDNKLYRGASRLSGPAEKEIRAGGRQNGKVRISELLEVLKVTWPMPLLVEKSALLQFLCYKKEKEKFVKYFNRDNVEWSEEQEAAAQAKVQENSIQFVPQDQQDAYEANANKHWNDFYKTHENGFFKDRHWLFTEFPELAPNLCDSEVGTCVTRDAVRNARNSNLESSSVHGLDSVKNSILKRLTSESDSSDMIHQFHAEVIPGSKTSEEQKIREHDFPGSSATYRILEVGCGAGNTVFPILQTNNDPGLFVYCCDFSTTAVDLVKAHPEYDTSRCFAFVHDLCKSEMSFPMPEESLDVVILIFVLSSILPEKMQCIINRLSQLLKPGGMILLRDYDELDLLFSTAGLEKVQNMVDRRLQVNRGKQVTMYRVWIQCKYRKRPRQSGDGDLVEERTPSQHCS
ncbi:hypothetical protein JD844_002231 [Phrynosoma platyrhinos]|uniref:EF-hand domain-containing protein n=1 Tax=Phrynosoma platyrhinos TaxID=52577 RepID=A0ABQ7TBA1_PHRPL|nr:hypothetical protein JD844_002231 [Phrynosoma platyrhinos]